MKDSETDADIQLKFETDLKDELEIIFVTMPSIQTQIPGIKIARIYVLISNIEKSLKLLAQVRQNQNSLIFYQI